MPPKPPHASSKLLHWKGTRLGAADAVRTITLPGRLLWLARAVPTPHEQRRDCVYAGAIMTAGCGSRHLVDWSHIQQMDVFAPEQQALSCRAGSGAAGNLGHFSTTARNRGDKDLRSSTSTSCS
jgi:hypothetical protein